MANVTFCFSVVNIFLLPDHVIINCPAVKNVLSTMENVIFAQKYSLWYFDSVKTITQTQTQVKDTFVNSRGNTSSNTHLKL